MRVLYSSNDLHQKILALLANPSPSDERVILVAYIGTDAEAFLPDPNKLKVVCCLKPGATDALVLSRLHDRKAKIFRSERLHMKVYWSRERGCVICSANASGAALGRYSQKEAGVFIEPGKVDINRLLRYARPKTITKKHLEKLTKDTERLPSESSNVSWESAPDFREWRKRGLNQWKICWWSEEARFAEESKQISRKRFGINPYDFLNVADGKLERGDWVLSFESPSLRSLDWLHVDFIVKTNPSYTDYEPDHPFQAVQANAPRRCPRPPFRLDRRFRRAFKGAVREYGLERIERFDGRRPSREFLDLIVANLD
ncbi:hypothetical protein [Afipia clevelandensis]|uniref:Phospholipase D-like domain-containing protein n=1 Tax=Afipia clevelandensis ATCC 49720 TaxID=883079 RepID=K8P2J2_9BRAD|nr:hypothetical protein [Afipia clevelandensis]EKS32653.1 hypothetical protein HMPREF9696_03630 [Afipia clevelandensis ATCC 49720]